jgi:hypothetical protein
MKKNQLTDLIIEILDDCLQVNLISMFVSGLATFQTHKI